MKLLEVDITEQPGTVTATVAGELDMSTVEELESRLVRALAGEPPVALLDLSGVTFLDSSGLRLMLRLHEERTERGARLVITGVGRRVARVFELTGAGERLEIVGDASEVSGG